MPVRAGRLVARVSAAAIGAHSTAVSSLWILPSGLLVVVVVVLVLAVLTLVQWRRRRTAGRRRRNSDETMNEDSDITSRMNPGRRRILTYTRTPDLDYMLQMSSEWPGEPEGFTSAAAFTSWQ